jgi:hypothetical protein
MNKHFQKAFDAMAAAKPVSGFRPENEAEWVALQRAQEEMVYAMFRGSSKSDVEAQALAEALYGGSAGQLLLRMAFSEDRHD